MLEAFPRGCRSTPRARGAARAAAPRTRARRPPAFRVGPVRDPDRCAARAHARLADRGDDPEPGVRVEVRGPHGGDRGDGALAAPHASAPRSRRPRRGAKYGFDDVRNVLERASARETAARVAAGSFCRWFLAELGMHVVSHVVRIGSVKAPARVRPRLPTTRPRSTVPGPMLGPRRLGRHGGRDRPGAEGAATVGGVFEVLAYGAPPGLGSHVHYDRARRPPRPGPHEHPVGEGGGGRRRVRDGIAPRLQGARRDRGARRSHRSADRARGASRVA